MRKFTIYFLAMIAITILAISLFFGLDGYQLAGKRGGIQATDAQALDEAAATLDNTDVEEYKKQVRPPDAFTKNDPAE